MLLPTLFAGVIAYVVLAAAFLIAARKTNTRSKLLGLAALAAAAPGFFWFGSFERQLSSGQCYSEVVHLIADAVDKTTSPRLLAQEIRGLPLYGYETECSEVETASRALPNAIGP